MKKGYKMNIEELHNELAELGISDDQYYLHGLYGSTSDRDKISLQIKKGKFFIEYEVYYRERTDIDSSKTFLTEDEACEYILKQFKP